MEQVAPPKELRPSPLLRKAGRHRRYMRWREPDTASAAISCRNGPVALPVLPYGIMARPSPAGACLSSVHQQKTGSRSPLSVRKAARRRPLRSKPCKSGNMSSLCHRRRASYHLCRKSLTPCVRQQPNIVFCFPLPVRLCPRTCPCDDLPRSKAFLSIEGVAEEMLPQGLGPGAWMHPQILGKFAAVQYRIGRTRRFLRPLRRGDGLHAAFVAR